MSVPLLLLCFLSTLGRIGVHAGAINVMPVYRADEVPCYPSHDTIYVEGFECSCSSPQTSDMPRTQQWFKESFRDGNLDMQSLVECFRLYGKKCPTVSSANTTMRILFLIDTPTLPAGLPNDSISFPSSTCRGNISDEVWEAPGMKGGCDVPVEAVDLQLVVQQKCPTWVQLYAPERLRANARMESRLEGLRLYSYASDVFVVVEVDYGVIEPNTEPKVELRGSVETINAQLNKLVVKWWQRHTANLYIYVQDVQTGSTLEGTPYTIPVVFEGRDVPNTLVEEVRVAELGEGVSFEQCYPSTHSLVVRGYPTDCSHPCEAGFVDRPLTPFSDFEDLLGTPTIDIATMMACIVNYGLLRCDAALMKHHSPLRFLLLPPGTFSGEWQSLPDPRSFPPNTCPDPHNQPGKEYSLPNLRVMCPNSAVFNAPLQFIIERENRCPGKFARLHVNRPMPVPSPGGEVVLRGVFSISTEVDFLMLEFMVSGYGKFEGGEIRIRSPLGTPQALQEWLDTSIPTVTWSNSSHGTEHLGVRIGSPLRENEEIFSEQAITGLPTGEVQGTPVPAPTKPVKSSVMVAWETEVPTGTTLADCYPALHTITVRGVDAECYHLCRSGFVFTPLPTHGSLLKKLASPDIAVGDVLQCALNYPTQACQPQVERNSTLRFVIAEGTMRDHPLQQPIVFPHATCSDPARTPPRPPPSPTAKVQCQAQQPVVDLQFVIEWVNRCAVEWGRLHVDPTASLVAVGGVLDVSALRLRFASELPMAKVVLRLSDDGQFNNGDHTFTAMGNSLEISLAFNSLRTATWKQGPSQKMVRLELVASSFARSRWIYDTLMIEVPPDTSGVTPSPSPTVPTSGLEVVWAPEGHDPLENCFPANTTLNVAGYAEKSRCLPPCTDGFVAEAPWGVRPDPAKGVDMRDVLLCALENPACNVPLAKTMRMVVIAEPPKGQLSALPTPFRTFPQSTCPVPSTPPGWDSTLHVKCKTTHKNVPLQYVVHWPTACAVRLHLTRGQTRQNLIVHAPSITIDQIVSSITSRFSFISVTFTAGSQSLGPFSGSAEQVYTEARSQPLDANGTWNTLKVKVTYGSSAQDEAGWFEDAVAVTWSSVPVSTPAPTPQPSADKTTPVPTPPPRSWAEVVLEFMYQTLAEMRKKVDQLAQRLKRTLNTRGMDVAEVVIELICSIPVSRKSRGILNSDRTDPTICISTTTASRLRPLQDTQCTEATCSTLTQAKFLSGKPATAIADTLSALATEPGNDGLKDTGMVSAFPTPDTPVPYTDAPLPSPTTLGGESPSGDNAVVIAVVVIAIIVLLSGVGCCFVYSRKKRESGEGDLGMPGTGAEEMGPVDIHPPGQMPPQHGSPRAGNVVDVSDAPRDDVP